MDLFGRKRIAELEKANSNLNHRLEQWEQGINPKLIELRVQQGVTNRAIGRIIAKLDPMYHIDEQDPRRRAESDAIGDQVLKKLLGEHKASNSFGG